jgi:RNA polymerase sigma-70 factor (ECF subfamily)
VPSKLIDSIDEERAVIASIDSLPDEGDLVGAAKRGDRQAFEVLVKRHAQRVFFVARRMTGTREDAEDVVQQSFQKAFTHLCKFEGRSAFSTWLTRIAINEALMLLRRGSGLREMFIDDLSGNEETTTAPEVPDSSPDPEVSYSLREREKILFSSLDELSHGTRRAIQLRELDGRSTDETARIMGISVDAVKARVFHGRRKLRQKLKRYVGLGRTSGRGASPMIGDQKHISQHHGPCDVCS